MKKLISILFLILFAVINCKKEKASLSDFEKSYVCIENGLTIAQTKKAGKMCRSGKEVMEIVGLMIKAGWTKSKIMARMRYIRQGRKIVKDLTHKGCAVQNKLKIDFFITPYCPYGIRFVDNVFIDLKEKFKEDMVWDPYFILYERDGQVASIKGPKEVEESTRQIFIRNKYGKEKWLNYFMCFAKDETRKTRSDHWKVCFQKTNVDINAYRKWIKTDMKKAQEKEIQIVSFYKAYASPTSVYNCNKQIVGAIPYNEIKDIICDFVPGKKPKACQK